MGIVRDRALVLSRHPFGESSLVAHVLSARNGRVHLLARGAYRPTSRYYAVLDLFDELELEWDHSPRRELDLLRAGSVFVRRRAIRADLERFRRAVSVLEYAGVAARPGSGEERLWEIVSAALEGLEGTWERPDVVQARFELGFLVHLGLAPALAACAACGQEARAVAGGPRPRVAFSAGAGGRLCRACADEARSAGRRVGTLPEEVLEDATRLVATDARITPALEPRRVECVRDFVGRFLDYHLEARPKSQRAFLAVPNRNAPVA